MRVFPQIPAEILDFIRENGKEYIPAVCPADIQRGKVGQCFDISIVNALDRKYRYVEGVAEHPTLEDTLILHAWLTDGEHAFDPTWRYTYVHKGRTPGITKIFPTSAIMEAPVPTRYTGIEMPVEDVARFMLETKYAGIFANAWRNPELADLCAKGIPSKKFL